MDFQSDRYNVTSLSRLTGPTSVVYPWAPRWAQTLLKTKKWTHKKSTILQCAYDPIITHTHTQTTATKMYMINNYENKKKEMYKNSKCLQTILHIFFL